VVHAKPTNVADSMSQEGRSRHHGVGADQAIFDHLLGGFDTRCRSQRTTDLTGKHSYP